ncbi:MAG: hypothetical protein DMG10_18215 [Acidobacteria bacterium]|nr:MAG: hypothetical protein DMG10_18215 [Acidobacteriota bacterium]
MHADVRSLIGVNRCFIGGSLLLGGNEVARYVFLVRTKFTNRSKFASRSWHSPVESEKLRKNRSAPPSGAEGALKRNNLYAGETPALQFFTRLAV